MRSGPVRLACAVALALVCAIQASAQKCPHGQIDIVQLSSQIETTKDPLVILRASAIGGQALIPSLRRVSKPGMSSETVAGAAQASLAKLGDEVAFVELDAELKGKIGQPLWAINKLLTVHNSRSISMIMAYLDAHPGPIMLGCEVDNCYNYVPEIYKSLADVVVNAPVQRKGKYKGDWILWGKHEQPVPFTLSEEFQDPYEQCLARKVEWGFDMALVDLAATGDQRAIPKIKQFGTLGYPYGGYAGSAAPFLWLRHDYVETALAKLGDGSQFAIIVAHLKTNSFQTEIQKLRIIGGKDSVEALVNSSNYFNTVWGGPFLKALSQMLQNPPLPPDAAPSEQNIRTWKDWWAKNKSAARFTNMPTFE